jgi:Ca-activated chloride channel family protein
LIEFTTPILILLLPLFIALTFMGHYFAQKIKRGLEVFHYPPLRRLTKISAQKSLAKQSWRGISLALKMSIIVLIAFSLAGPVLITASEISRTVEVPMVEEKDLVGGIVLVVDASSSMGFGDVLPTRLEAAKNLLVQFVQNASGKVRFGVVAFDADVRDLLPLTEDKQQILPVIRGLNRSEIRVPCLEEYTDIGYGIQTAVDMLVPYVASNNPYAIVLISDGYTNYGYPDPLTSVRTAVREAVNAKVQIFTVHIAKMGLDSNPELLQSVANETGGKFMESTNYEELQKAFDALSKYHTPTNTWNAKVEIKTTIPQRADLGHVLMIGAVACVFLLWIGNYRHYKTWF